MGLARVRREREPGCKLSSSKTLERVRLEARVALDVARAKLSARSDPNRPGAPIILNSLPKSGTHLALKLLRDLPGLTEVRFQLSAFTADFFAPDSDEDTVDIGVTMPRAVSLAKVRRRLSEMPAGSFISAHVPHSEEMAAVLRELDYKMVVLLRDPRDVAVSSAAYIVSRSEHPLHEAFTELTPEQRQHASIAGVDHPGIEMRDLRSRVESVTEWRREPNVVAIKFEDLVGPQGGGDAVSQHESILTVARHVGVHLDDSHAQAMAESLYGGTVTFRRGQIGGWRETLSPADRERVGRLLGDVLLELEYEEDDSWWREEPDG